MGTSELPVLDAQLWAQPDPVPSPTPLHPATTSNRDKILWSELLPLLCKNPMPRDAVLVGAEKCPPPMRACRANKGGFLSNKRSKGMKCQKLQPFLLAGHQCLHLLCRAHPACKALPLVLSPIYTLSTWEMGDQTGRRRRRRIEYRFGGRRLSQCRARAAQGLQTGELLKLKSPLEMHLADGLTGA